MSDLPFENILWMSVLRSLSGYQMYQKMGVRIRPGDVLLFMLRSKVSAKCDVLLEQTKEFVPQLSRQ